MKNISTSSSGFPYFAYLKPLIPIVVSYLALSLGLSSCGIPQILYLDPPEFATTGSNAYELRHTTANYNAAEGSSQSFKGYELAYKAFDSPTKAEDSLASIASRIDQYPNSPDILLNYFRVSLGYGFISGEDEPLIAISNPSAEQQYTLALELLGSDADWTLSKESTVLFKVYRDPAVNSSRKSFTKRENWIQTDPDYEGQSNPDHVWFAIFAIAYADDPETVGQKIYSMPSVLSPIYNIAQYF